MSGLLAKVIRIGRASLLFRWRVLTQPSVVTVRSVKLSTVGPHVTPPIKNSIYSGTYEQAECEILERTLARGDRYMEIGGGVGFLAVQAAKRVGSNADVHVYEANPRLASVIEGTFKLNAVSASVHSCVIGHEDTEATFHVRPDYWISSTIPSPGSEQIKVPQRKLSAEALKVRATYLMVDIEGGERDLFSQGCPECVRKICVETHPEAIGSEGVSRMVRCLLSDGFRIDLLNCSGRVLYFERPAV